jgi:DNA-binding response OmpR family regulator
MDAVSATAPVERRTVPMRRILVVDDELMMLASMRRALREEFEVETASSGSEALEKLGSFHPDLVLADLQMPLMDGGQLLREVRARDPRCETVLMSGDVPGRAVHDFPVLQKPFSFDELLARARGGRTPTTNGR